MLDPSSLTDDLEEDSEDLLWSMLDYGILGTSAQRQRKEGEVAPPEPNNSPVVSSILPFPVSNSEQVVNPMTSLFSPEFLNGLSPEVRTSEIEYLLDCIY